MGTRRRWWRCRAVVIIGGVVISVCRWVCGAVITTGGVVQGARRRSRRGGGAGGSRCSLGVVLLGSRHCLCLGLVVLGTCHRLCCWAFVLLEWWLWALVTVHTGCCWSFVCGARHLSLPRSCHCQRGGLGRTWDGGTHRGIRKNFVSRPVRWWALAIVREPWRMVVVRCRLGDHLRSLVVIFVFGVCIVVSNWSSLFLVCALSFPTGHPRFGAVDFNGGLLSTW
jgi:hypothetical protein